MAEIAITRRSVTSGIVVVVAAALAYFATSGALFWVAPGVQVALFTGAVAGLAASSVLQASIAAPLTVVLAAMVFPPWYVTRLARPLGAGEALVLLVGCTLAALGVSWLRLRSELPVARANRYISVALLLMVVANMWITPLTVASLSSAQNGTDLAADLKRELPPMSYSSDADAYLRTYQLMQAGTPYYEAVRESWLGKAGTESLPWGVVSYRLPTLYWLWSALPAGGYPLIPAFLLFTTAAVVAAFMVPAQLGLIRLAPVSAALVAGTYLVTAVSTFITYVDPWGMALALGGFAVLLGAEIRNSTRLTWLSVALFIAAALVREILIYLPMAFAASALLLPKGQRLKASAPWLAGIAAFAVAYAAHVLAIDGQVAPTPLGEVWTRGSMASLVAAVNLGQELMTGRPWMLPLALVLGALGAAGLWRAVNRRISAVAMFATTVPLLSLAFLGNPGTAPGAGLVNYWGMLCIPLNLALAPASILLLRPASAKPATKPAEKPSAKRKKAKKRS